MTFITFITFFGVVVMIFMAADEVAVLTLVGIAAKEKKLNEI